jgi:uncharacterized protein YkwD
MHRVARRASVVVGLLALFVLTSWLPWRSPELPDTLSATADVAPRRDAPPVTADGRAAAGVARPASASPSAAKPSARPSAAPSQSARRAPRATRKVRPPAPPSGDVAMTAEVVRLVNVERGKAGCGAVHADARLDAAALGHSRDMAARNYFSHDTPDGVSPWDRAKAAGYAQPTGENIAMGYRDAAAVVTGWMNSAGHRANILNCNSKAIGNGVARKADGTAYWTQMFGAV